MGRMGFCIQVGLGTLGLYRDNGKQHGNFDLGLRDQGLGLGFGISWCAGLPRLTEYGQRDAQTTCCFAQSKLLKGCDMGDYTGDIKGDTRS